MSRMFRVALTTSLLLGCLYAPHSLAGWQLNNQLSQLSFVSVKAKDIAEAHTFKELRGGIDASGEVELVIELASVDTLIPIRDERMQKLLFETNLFPKARFKTRVDLEKLSALPVGSADLHDVTGTLTLKEATMDMSARLLVTRLSEGRVTVSTLKPILVNAGALGLADGIEALRQIAGLPSISLAVPVSFVLTFDG